MARPRLDHHPPAGGDLAEEVGRQRLRRDQVAWQRKDAAIVPGKGAVGIAVRGEDDFFGADIAFCRVGEVAARHTLQLFNAALADNRDTALQRRIQQPVVKLAGVERPMLRHQDAAMIQPRADLVAKIGLFHNAGLDGGWRQFLSQSFLIFEVLAGPRQRDAARLLVVAVDAFADLQIAHKVQRRRRLVKDPLRRFPPVKLRQSRKPEAGVGAEHAAIARGGADARMARLDNGDLGARIMGGDGGGKACVAGADNQDVSPSRRLRRQCWLRRAILPPVGKAECHLGLRSGRRGLMGTLGRIAVSAKPARAYEARICEISHFSARKGACTNFVGTTVGVYDMGRFSFTGALAALMGFVAVETADAAPFRLDITGVITNIPTVPGVFELSNPTIAVGDDLFVSLLFDDAALEAAFDEASTQTARFPISSGVLTLGGLAPIDILANPRGLGVRATEDERNDASTDGFEVLVNAPGQTGSVFRTRFSSTADVFETSTPDQLSALAGTGFGAFGIRSTGLEIEGDDTNPVPTVFGDCFSILNLGCPVDVEISTVSVSAISEVPLPAGGALLLTGLGVFALFRRRQA